MGVEYGVGRPSAKGAVTPLSVEVIEVVGDRRSGFCQSLFKRKSYPSGFRKNHELCLKSLRIVVSTRRDSLDVHEIPLKCWPMADARTRMPCALQGFPSPILS